MKKACFIVLLLSLLISVPGFGQEKLFPEIKGWTLAVENNVYDANNLWDLIDGAADLFLEYSFVNLHYARYTSGAGIEVKAELYKHQNELYAFGIYSQERDPGYHFIQIGAQGYLEEGALNYLDGSYYIKLSTLQKGKEAQDALLSIATAISENLKQENGLPALLSCLPADARIINSEKYISQNFLGYSFLKSVFLARYNADAPFTAFIIEAENNENATAIIKQLIDSSGGQNTISLGEGKSEIKDRMNGVIDISSKGKFIYGLIGCSGASVRDKYLDELSSLLK